MSFAFIAVSVTQNFEPLNSAIDVFNNDSFPRKIAVKAFLLVRQRIVFALFIRSLTVCVKLDDSLITAVCQKLDERVNPNEFILKKREIMRFSACLRDADNL